MPPIKNGRVLPTPAKAIRARLNRGNWEVLIQWVGRPAGNATWEKVSEFSEQHPEFQLGDELFRKEGGSVVGAFVGRTYSRRHRTGNQDAAPAE